MELFRTLIGPDDGQAGIGQMCFRTLILFIFGIICIRIAGRRTFAQASPLDIIVAIVVGSNISRVMIGRAPFWASLAATLLLVLLHRALAMGTLRWNLLSSWVRGSAVDLVVGGVANEKAMFRHAIGHDDLMEGLRMEQVDDLAKVKRATLEAGGKISVIPNDKSGG
jgi:uncharacterized membrane protein YcaP (DUF421 family)